MKLKSLMVMVSRWALVLLAQGPVLAADTDDGFRPLFDGKTLHGWVNVNCAPETWTIQNGLLHCDGVPTGALRTEKQYENFILELEWRHLKPGGNAGVFVWASPLPALGQPFLRAVEVQVLENAYGQSEWHTTHGDVFPIHGSTMKPFPPSRGQRSFPTAQLSKGSPEWNHYRITCTNGTIRLAVNGTEVSGGSDCNWRHGYLALESEGGQVDWRHLRIKELPSSGATPAQSAPAAEPWQSIYDGRTLRGWNVAPDQAAHWKAADWTLRFQKDDPQSSVAGLWLDRNLEDFEFRADWQWETEPAARVLPFELRSLDTERRRVAWPAEEQAALKGWNRLHLVRRGSELTVAINDHPPRSVPVPKATLTLGLVGNAAKLRFASLFLK